MAKKRDQRQPWIKWYTRDWRSDAPLRMCSFAARGLWADMLSLMAESKHFGFLLIEDVVPTARQLAGLLGGNEKEITRLLDELCQANVFSLSGDDLPEDIADMIPASLPRSVILSRRMLRDKAKADKDRANGKGGGNPKLAQPDNGGVNPPDNPQANPQKSEARSQSSVPNGTGADAPVDPVKALFDAGVDLLTKAGTKPQNARSLIGKWRSDYGNEAAMAAIGAANIAKVSEPVEWVTKYLANHAKPKDQQRGESWNDRRIREAMEAIRQ